VFKLDKTNKETVLHSFAGGTADGEFPYAGLVRDTSGNLYGTTYQGGASGWGTVFKVDGTDKETLLHSFAYSTDGGYPYAGMVRDTAGNLYGATENGVQPAPVRCSSSSLERRWILPASRKDTKRSERCGYSQDGYATVTARMSSP
jgi:uncharacterized repeat protein (TIGR03803 family)